MTFRISDADNISKNLEPEKCKDIVGNYEKRYLTELIKMVIEICVLLSNCET